MASQIADHPASPPFISASAVQLHQIKLATKIPARKQRGQLPQSPTSPRAVHSSHRIPQPPETSLAPTSSPAPRLPPRAPVVQREASASYQTLRGTLTSESSTSLDERAATGPRCTVPCISGVINPPHTSNPATSLARLFEPCPDQVEVAIDPLTQSSDEIVDASRRDLGIVSDIDSSTTTIWKAKTAMRRQMSPIEPLQGPNRKNDVVVGDSEEEGENLVDALSDGSINVPSRPNCIQSKLRDSGSVRSETIASTHDLLNSSPAHRSRTRSTFGSSSIGRITNREFTENGFVLEVTAQPSKIASKRAKSAPVRRATSSKRARAAPEPVDSEMEHHGSDFFVDEADLRSLLTSSVSGTTIQRAVDTDMPIGSGKPCPALVGKTTPGEPDSQDLRKRKKRFDNEFSGSLAKAGSRKAIEHGPSTRTSSPMELLPISSPPAERSPSCKSPQHGPRNALHVQSEPIAEKRENPVRGLAGILTRKGIAGVRHPGLSKAAKVPRLHINLKPPPPPKSSIPKPKEKKKGDESYSDEEKPWWKTKHPEEWTDEDFERYRRITERRERGLDSD